MRKGFIDLRSDTVTKPTQRMRDAMAKAEVGDDVYGEDPTLNLLQDTGARLLGKEAGIFMPSGTMANQVALKSHTQPGDEVIVESSSHIYNFELGAMAVLSGTIPRVVAGESGFICPGDLKKAVRPDIYYLSKATLLALENTHNMAGGRCLPVERSEELCAIAKEKGLKCHLDGARIFNAAAALKVDAKRIAEPFDSVMFCFSKGLSAPAGSLLVGERSFVERARKFRKMFGGGMRQAGILAAACLVALEEVLPRLEEDHKKARTLASAAKENAAFDVELGAVETNIFMIDVKPPKTAGEVVQKFKEAGILVSSISETTIRLVTHKDITEEDTLQAEKFLKEFS